MKVRFIRKLETEKPQRVWNHVGEVMHDTQAKSKVFPGSQCENCWKEWTTTKKKQKPQPLWNDAMGCLLLGG